jgi:hypothetical protein
VSFHTWSRDLAILIRRGIVDDNPLRIASTLFEDWIRAHAKS